jgi:hypothetical protein
VHDPPLHALCGGHGLPQPPQLFGSVCVFVQTPLQSCMPLPHVIPQTAFTHVAVPPSIDGHTFVQLPQ